MTDSAPFVDPVRTAPGSATTVALSTRHLTTSEQREVWAETLDSTYCEMDVDWPSGSDAFAADIVARSVGSMSVSVVRADPHTVVRTPTMIDSDPGDDLLLCLITRGTATISQDGRTGVLDGGAFGFVDSARPFVVRGDTEFEQIVVRLGRDLLAPQVAENKLDHSLGQRFAATGGIDRVASHLLVDLASHDDEFTAGDLTAVTSAVLDVIAAAVNTRVSIGSLTDQAHDADLRRVQQVMMREISNPDHRLTDVGAEVGMSVRYIHKLFSAVGTTPRTWLYTKRFGRAQALLLQTDLPVSEIAEQLGFRDVSHFSRAFSRHHGTSPGRYRTENG
ncbi:AraC family transcriptional regulator [Gordonia sp. OPL2]|uniref:helix-turn-helix transcriptional regulator n=1 Tax=Gordonia sp. OPL2 TaxID=2486274 RepID=UPI0016561EAC|nr:AraC family transcriptional regulator [Gordonia sp. OPL2]RPA06245.1 AraC family transcriptional regulator [Gordonia sp. OPL2]